MLIFLLFITICSIANAEKPGKHGFLSGATNTAPVNPLSENLLHNDFETVPQNNIKQEQSFGTLDAEPCTTPINNMAITSDVWFCNTPENRYYLYNGIYIRASDIIVDCNNVTLYSNTQSYNGIYFDSVDNVTLKNCYIEKYAYGIRLDYSTNNKLYNISSSDNSYAGILLDHSPNTEISNSVFSNNYPGFYAYYSDHNIIKNSEMNSNWGNGIYLSYSNHNLIEHNYMESDYHGISLMFSSYNNFTNNTLNSNQWMGIRLGNLSNNNILTHNIAYDNLYGFTMVYSSNNNILTHNTAYDNIYGFTVIYSSNNNVLTYNTANDNHEGGFGVGYSSNNNTLTNNTANSNTGTCSEPGCLAEGVGIILISSSDNKVINNTLNSNNASCSGLGCTAKGYGIYLGNSSNNNEVKNNIMNDNQYGINLEFDSDYNDLIDNKITKNSKTGVHFFTSDSNFNNLSRNKICYNALDVNDSDANTGDENICDTTINYNDTGSPGCTYFCNPFPEIQKIECQENNSVWGECLDIAYGDYLTAVRVNCTDADGIKSASLRLVNIPDNYEFFDSSATKVGDYWVYNTDILIQDSGEFELTAYCTDNLDEKESKSFNWFIAYGSLHPYLIDPTANKTVTQNRFFSFSSGVDCIGGECGDIDATLDPADRTTLFYEGFESGFGNWNNVIGDDFSWTRYSGSTPSSSTGPSSAHGGSYYVYTESSSPNYPLKVAILEGPVMNLDAYIDERIEFWYHMYGSSMGSLYLEIYDSGTWTELWSMAGNQGDVWHKAVVDLSSSGQKLRFRMVTGSSIASDAAIDDINITATEGKDAIPMDSGTPFYTTDPNPTTCYNMKAGSSCNQTWQINATGNENTSYDFFTIYSPVNYADYLSENQTPEIRITIPPNPPMIHKIECQENNSVWQDCSDILYNDYLTAVRVNCTDIDGIKSASLRLFNVLDSYEFFSGYAIYENGYWVYDNSDILLQDSGGFDLTANCTDNWNYKANQTYNWTVPFGTLQPYLINPRADTQVSKDEFFSFSSGVECVGGECGNVTAILDPVVPSVQWHKTFGGSGSDVGYSVQQTTDGGYIIAGYTTSFGTGSTDVYLIKTYSNGSLQWQRTFGGGGSERGYSVQQTTDGGYIIAGYTNSIGAGSYDVYLIKTDSNGDFKWHKTFGSPGADYGKSVQQTSDGGYIIAGHTMSFGQTSDIYFIKTGSSGSFSWSVVRYFYYGGVGSYDYAYSVQQTTDGGYIIAGGTGPNGRLIKTNSNGNGQWSRAFGEGGYYDRFYSVQQTTDSGYVAAGYTYSYGAGGSDVYLIKTNTSGYLEWNKTFGDAVNDFGRSVQQTMDGGYIIAGNTYSFGNGDSDFYLVKADESGNLEWNQTFGGIHYDNAYSVQQTTDGGYIVVGATNSSGADNLDVLLAKFEPDRNKGIVPMNNGTPFYTIDPNPITCYNMEAGSSCNQTWIVNATGMHETNWTFFTTYESEYSADKQTNEINVEIAAPAITEIHSIECQENGSAWSNCFDISYNDYLTAVRINCTDEDGIKSASLRLVNIPDDNAFFDSPAVQAGDYWLYDNTDILIQDSGEFELTAYCTDNLDNTGIRTIRWLVPFGILQPYLINPTANITVTKDRFFSFSSGIKCAGGECGNMTAALDPQKNFNYRAKDDILLKSRKFNPKKILDEKLKAKIKSRGKTHVLIQFETIPTKEEKKQLEKKGIKLLSYIPNQAWFASLTGKPEEIIALPNVRAISEILTEDKISPSIKNKNYLKNEQNKINFSIKFFDDVDLDDASSVMENYGKVVDKFPAVNTVKLITEERLISNIADEENVQWINIMDKVIRQYNDDSRKNVGVNTLQASPYGLSGNGIVVSQWDVGWADPTHDDLSGRVIVGDFGCSEPDCKTDDHATHVAGTMLGGGNIIYNYRGMAPQATLITYEAWDDSNELNSEYDEAIYTYDVSLSQNSWGYEPFGCVSDCFGIYDSDAAELDGIVRGSKGKRISQIWSAGNDRPTDCDNSNYDCIGLPGTAKNVITVGATDSDTDAMTDFSSWGPTNDGRLKPEVTAPGCEDNANRDDSNPSKTIWSTVPTDTYTGMCGTSMSAPVVSGVVALMLEEYANKGIYPLPSTIKSLLIHTAKDLGNAGPDYSFGYGRINALAAVDKIKEDTIGNNVITEDLISQGETNIFSIIVPEGAASIKTTIVWDDYPGTPNANPALVNDLDLVLIAPNGTVYYPWVLNPASPSSAATKDFNYLDNVEQVLVDNPIAGAWTIEVFGWAIPMGPQDFSLVSDFNLYPGKGIIPMNTGVPFYTITQNPMYPQQLSCLIDMQDGDSCNQTWTVNATGDADTSYDFFTIYFSLAYTIDGAQTPHVNITITSESRFSINLLEGWNLISFPLNFTNVTEIFEPIEAYFDSMFAYDAEQQKFIEIEPFNGGEFDLRYGVWINVWDNVTLNIVGEKFENTDIPLAQGWNLVGHPYVNEKDISELYENYSVYAYDGMWFSYNPNRTFNSLQTLWPGYGYWVKNS